MHACELQHAAVWEVGSAQAQRSRQTAGAELVELKMSSNASCVNRGSTIGRMLPVAAAATSAAPAAAHLRLQVVQHAPARAVDACKTARNQRQHVLGGFLLIQLVEHKLAAKCSWRRQSSSIPAHTAGSCLADQHQAGRKCAATQSKTNKTLCQWATHVKAVHVPHTTPTRGVAWWQHEHGRPTPPQTSKLPTAMPHQRSA